MLIAEFTSSAKKGNNSVFTPPSTELKQGDPDQASLTASADIPNLKLFFYKQETVMASKQELQDTLKREYGINKNISDDLSKEECEKLIQFFSDKSAPLKLIEKFVQKNKELGENNRRLGQQRSQAEKEVALQNAKCEELDKANTELKKDNKYMKNIMDKIKLDLVVQLRKAITTQDTTEIKRTIAELIKKITG